MSNEFDLFATPEEDNLKEELAKGSYRWTNKATAILGGLLVVVASLSAGAWYGHRSASSSTVGNFASLRSAFGGLGGANSGAALGSGSSASAGTGATAGGTGSGFGGGFGRGTSGTITKISGTTIVITKSDGTTVTINAAADTPVIKSSQGAITDLKVGDTITATGPAGSDGSIQPFAITQGAGLPRGGFGGGTGTGTGGAATASANPVPAPSTSSSVVPQSAKSAKTSGASPAATRPAIGGASGSRGAGRFSNPAFTACMTKNGVTFTAGTRPDFTDPKVAAAMAACRSTLPAGGFGGGRPSGAPSPAAS